MRLTHFDIKLPIYGRRMKMNPEMGEELDSCEGKGGYIFKLIGHEDKDCWDIFATKPEETRKPHGVYREIVFRFKRKDGEFTIVDISVSEDLSGLIELRDPLRKKIREEGFQKPKEVFKAFCDFANFMGK